VSARSRVPRHVAFLRAINVGGRTVRMEALRRLFEEMGFTNVETFIASGNVIFDAPVPRGDGLERRIEQALREALGYEVATFVRTPAELADVVRHEPFDAADVEAARALYVLFLKAPLGDAARQALAALRTETDDFHSHGREAYWLVRTPMSESKVTGARLERALGGPATARNVTTVRKLAAKYAAP
jgi:uncharacterized protein (DUF1697 family)